MLLVNTTTLLLSLQSPGTYAAFLMPIIQSTSATRQPTVETILASPSAQSGLSWSHVRGRSDPTVGLLTPRKSTTNARKSGMPAEGQASLLASTTIECNSTNNAAGGGLLLAAQSDAALAESLIAALLEQQVYTITTVPLRTVVQSITTSTIYPHAFAMATR